MSARGGGQGSQFMLNANSKELKGTKAVKSSDEATLSYECKNLLCGGEKKRMGVKGMSIMKM